ncbi:hypothetical protein GN956_G14367 [Arapaima gigas]
MSAEESSAEEALGSALLFAAAWRSSRQRADAAGARAPRGCRWAGFRSRRVRCAADLCNKERHFLHHQQVQSQPDDSTPRLLRATEAEKPSRRVARLCNTLSGTEEVFKVDKVLLRGCRNRKNGVEPWMLSGAEVVKQAVEANGASNIKDQS